MSRSRGIGIGIPFFSQGGLPYKNNLLRFLRPRTGIRIYDLIGTFDAEENVVNEYDMNPDGSSSTEFALQAMNKSDLTIWAGVDRNGNTIRDLPGYNILNPFEWLDAELDVDIINTYISDGYTARVFSNFFGDVTDLAIYDQQMSCQQSIVIHKKLKTGGWWIFNRGVLNGCGVIKADGVIWGT